MAGVNATGSAEKPVPPAVSLSRNYTRLAQIGADTFAMEIAVRTFTPTTGKGATITLISAVHIGSKAYYTRLQELLDAQTLVFVEGIAGDPPATQEEDSGGSDLYDRLAEASGLVSQAEAIEYDREHFKNADLSLGAMREILQAEIDGGGKGGAAAKEALSLLNETAGMLKGKGGFATLVMSAFAGMMQSNPQLRTLFLYKVSMAELTMTEHDNASAFSSLTSTPGLRRLERLLLIDRNAAVMNALKKELARANAPSDIGVFYGAAHMRDMEKTLVRQMGYKLVKTEWLTAYTIHPKASKLPGPIIAVISRSAAKISPPAESHRPAQATK
jgi:hypothetical protein